LSSTLTDCTNAVYDVSEGKEYYGPGRSYHHFVGKDATRAFCTGCSEPECLVRSLQGLPETLKKEASRWLELYHYHDKYKFIGHLIEDPVDIILQRSLKEEQRLKSVEFLTPEELKEKGKEEYKKGSIEVAISFWRGCLVRLGEHNGEKADHLQEKEILRADVLNFLATACQKSGDINGAVQYYEEALEILGLVLSEHKYATFPLRANVQADLASAYFAQNKIEQAIESFLIAEAIYESLLETNDSLEPLYANTVVNLAYTYSQHESTSSEAIEALNKLLIRANTFKNPHDPRTIEIMELANEGLNKLVF